MLRRFVSGPCVARATGAISSGTRRHPVSRFSRWGSATPAESFIATADLCDLHEDAIIYPKSALFRDFGGRLEFQGTVSTIKCFEDNSLVKEAVEEDGRGRVLVIDGAGSLDRALVGDMIAAKAVRNGWEGVFVHGCIRDAAEIAKLDIGVKALGTNPRKTPKKGQGLRDVPVSFAGVLIEPGMRLVADLDGVVLFPKGFSSA
eukprot:TRINITY_DN73867_c0_g1_i1.p1 TRINITY_DN73867_c0_g1~~TRINITY_DN73867_c0_g1_i1.p1  ORF type:complete len:215 (+),score=13.83 TRINITY_DN73867_c0_g1_i1:37-645(+)